jgi:hypothetical protein
MEAIIAIIETRASDARAMLDKLRADKAQLKRKIDAIDVEIDRAQASATECGAAIVALRGLT